MGLVVGFYMGLVVRLNIGLVVGLYKYGCGHEAVLFFCVGDRSVVLGCSL